MSARPAAVGAAEPPPAATSTVSVPRRPAGWLLESERELRPARVVPALTLFLVGARCPFGCVFCDLDAQTIPTATPAGAIPAQIAAGLAAAGPLPAAAAVKLYNASNFFSQRAVPAADDDAVARLVAPFARVTVECHPRLVGARAFRFAERLDGRLEVAMGLETIAPHALARLGKGMTRLDFDRSVRALTRHGIAVRAFVLLAPPFVASGDAVEWAVRSVAHAVAAGAGRVTLIPTRGDSAALRGLVAAGEFHPPSLEQLEEALDRTVETDAAIITADLWDAARQFAGEPRLASRLDRLRRLNLGGRRQAADAGGPR